MHDAMGSKAAMGMSMMALPDPKVMEYELTKGMHAPDTAQPGSELTLSLDATTTDHSAAHERREDAGGLRMARHHRRHGRPGDPAVVAERHGFPARSPTAAGISS